MEVRRGGRPVSGGGATASENSNYFFFKFFLAQSLLLIFLVSFLKLFLKRGGGDRTRSKIEVAKIKTSNKKQRESKQLPFLPSLVRFRVVVVFDESGGLVTCCVKRSLVSAKKDLR